MKAIYLILVFLGVLIGNKESIGQDIATSTIQWSADRIFNATAGQWSEEATSIVTYGTTRIEWKNGNGSIRHRFQVVELVGEWHNVNAEGYVQYEVTNGTTSGTVTIRKRGSETKILVSLGTAEPTLEELTISSKQIL